jgi:hypothetical protein
VFGSWEKMYLESLGAMKGGLTKRGTLTRDEGLMKAHMLFRDYRQDREELDPSGRRIVTQRVRSGKVRPLQYTHAQTERCTRGKPADRQLLVVYVYQLSQVSVVDALQPSQSFLFFAPSNL